MIIQVAETQRKNTAQCKLFIHYSYEKTFSPLAVQFGSASQRMIAHDSTV